MKLDIKEVNIVATLDDLLSSGRIINKTLHYSEIEISKIRLITAFYEGNKKDYIVNMMSNVDKVLEELDDTSFLTKGKLVFKDIEEFIKTGYVVGLTIPTVNNKVTNIVGETVGVVAVDKDTQICRAEFNTGTGTLSEPVSDLPQAGLVFEDYPVVDVNGDILKAPRYKTVEILSD